VIGEALAQTKAEGLRIVPMCPTVAAYIQKHQEYADITDRPGR
jgi:predicted GNAT family acetyltransferase